MHIPPGFSSCFLQIFKTSLWRKGSVKLMILLMIVLTIKIFYRSFVGTDEKSIVVWRARVKKERQFYQSRGRIVSLYLEVNVWWQQ